MSFETCTLILTIQFIAWLALALKNMADATPFGGRHLNDLWDGLLWWFGDIN